MDSSHRELLSNITSLSREHLKLTCDIRVVCRPYIAKVLELTLHSDTAQDGSWAGQYGQRL